MECEEGDCAGSSGCRRSMRLLGSKQCVDQRRLAYVRASKEGDLGRAERLRVGREVGDIGGGEQEYRRQSHRSSLRHRMCNHEWRSPFVCLCSLLSPASTTTSSATPINSPPPSRDPSHTIS